MKPVRIRRREIPAEAEANLEDLPPLLRRLYAARGIRSSAELSRTLDILAPPKLLKGMDVAVHLLYDSLVKQENILIVADYDADGATSCALMVKALRQMGARRVGYLVPNRFEYGYGLTPEIVEIAAAKSPDLIVTVDNGIASISGVKRAKELGIPVLITDHHLPPEQLPDAAAIVNPNQHGDSFPSKCLAGVGVAFYLLMALRLYLRDANWFATQKIDEPNLAQYLDLVALGTVADIVPLDQCNRALVYQGLRRIAAGEACDGVQALLQVAGKSATNIQASDLGFSLGPRLNAAGRLDDMTVGIECLLAEDAESALILASQLDSLNRSRRQIEARMQQEALTLVDQIATTALPTGICLMQPDWHTGVVGIVASRLKERCARPVIVFSSDGAHTLKGSGRAISGFHIRDALANIDAKYPDLILKFGGHAMAAGLSIRVQDYEQFAEAFNCEAEASLAADQLQQIIESDGELAVEQLDLVHAEQLQQAGPWGQHFPEPCFDGQFCVEDYAIVAEKHVKMRLKPTGGTPSLNAIWFSALDRLPARLDQVRIAYRLTVNEYLATRSVQLIVEYLEPLN